MAPPVLELFDASFSWREDVGESELPQVEQRQSVRSFKRSLSLPSPLPVGMQVLPELSTLPTPPTPRAVRHHQHVQEDESILRCINLSLRPGQLMAVLGGAGSGKTTLLMALLNEVPCIAGRSLVPGKTKKVNGAVAYCGQQPHLIRGTVRENVLFGRCFQEQLPSLCISLCGVNTDDWHGNGPEPSVVVWFLGELRCDRSGKSLALTGPSRLAMDDSPTLTRSSRNDRLPAGSPAFLPRNRRLLVSRARNCSSDSDGPSSRCAKCGHLLMDLVFCRNCGARRVSDLRLSEAFGGIQDALQEDRQHGVVLHALEAVSYVMQDMLQVKYGLVLDEADLLGKLRHHCNGSTPEEVVQLFNGQRDLHFRTRGSQRLITIRLDWKPADSFEQLRRKIRAMPGTCRALCSADSGSTATPATAAALFRESYCGEALVGKSAGSLPLLQLTAGRFASSAAVFVEPQILSELRTGPQRKPVECTAPAWREEYTAALRAEEAVEQPVPRLQLPSRDSSRRRRSPRKTKEELSSARLTQCSTEASSRHSPERQAGGPAVPAAPPVPGPPVPVMAMAQGLEPRRFWDGAWEPLATWPGVGVGSVGVGVGGGGGGVGGVGIGGVGMGGGLGLTPPNGLQPPQLTPRVLIPPQMAGMPGVL
ncbi:unnamed protein product [Effrenium voratum]|nr:unnamed protein product [Effrenium voratum]